MGIRQQIKSLLKALLEWSISAPLAEADSDEAAPRCPVRQLFEIYIYIYIYIYICKTHQNAPVRKSLFNKFAVLKLERPQHGCFLVDFFKLKILKI